MASLSKTGHIQCVSTKDYGRHSFRFKMPMNLGGDSTGPCVQVGTAPEMQKNVTLRVHVPKSYIHWP